MSSAGVRLRDDASHFSCATFVSGRPRRRMSATLPGTTAGVDALLGRLVTDWRPTIVGLRTAKRGLGAYQGGECRTPQSGEWWRGACTPYALVFGRPGQGHCPPAVLGESGAAAPRSPAGRNLRGDRGRLRRSPASWPALDRRRLAGARRPIQQGQDDAANREPDRLSVRQHQPHKRGAPGNESLTHFALTR